MSDQTRKSPPKLFVILTIVLSIVVTLLLIEGFLAFVRPVPFSVERNMYYENDPYTGYHLRPNSVGYFQHGIVAATNSNGHRDDETTVAKPEGIFRILLLGDSFTAGANVEQNEAYGQVLESVLNETSGKKIEVVNTGVGGWEPFQYAQYFEHYGRNFDPDLVLVGFFVGNDAFNQLDRVEQLPTTVAGRRVSPAAAASPLIKLQVFLNEHSNLARLLMGRAPENFEVTRTTCYEFPSPLLALQTERLVSQLRLSPEREALAANAIAQIDRIKEMTDEMGIPLAVAIIPDENQINPVLQAAIIPADQLDNYDFQMPQAQLVPAFEKLGITTIDLLPTILADPRCLYMNDTHWTPEAHRLAAETIAGRLVPIIKASES